ncbi:PREDICTED: putative neural-cadherin 2 [Priapulus caudatus]|uniref:Neural-cadherin 2 n=1 Tax=Priapulus caudatus TaxID=37621 RepID=A0ABM1EH20_PRICU|nr:PREDICTED: putative neural-cadherin 2 [Priapulus caudatus]
MTANPEVIGQTRMLLTLVDPCPRFQQAYDIRVKDGTGAGTQLEPVACPADCQVLNLAQLSPPFTFRHLDATFAEAFRIDTDGASCAGQGGARLYTQRAMDRTRDKTFRVPVEICDVNQMCDSDDVLVTVEDTNTHAHEPGTKHITVFSYKDSIPEDTPIGTVYAPDEDDWDIVDKTFAMVAPPPEKFSVDAGDGTIRIKDKTPSGQYTFKVDVTDETMNRKVTSTVNVEVRGIWDDAVFSSGSLRINGVTAREFIVSDVGTTSKLSQLRSEIARATGAKEEKVEIFSVMDRKGSDPPQIDVRYAASGSPYYPAEKLDGAVAAELPVIAQTVGIDIIMVPIDECIREICQGAPGCRTVLSTSLTPTYINTNATSMLGVSTYTTTDCVCNAKDDSAVDTCNTPGAICLNGGTCTDTASGARRKTGEKETEGESINPSIN